jgi:hypothetical protein
MSHLDEDTTPLTADELARIGRASVDQGDCIIPVPKDAGVPKGKLQGREPDRRFAYKNADGKVLGYVLRWDAHNGTDKDIRPATFWRNGSGKGKWQLKIWPGKRPLFGLDQLAAKPDAIVLLVEGEKAAEAVEHGPLADALKWGKVEVIGITWPGGTNAIARADFQPLAGRDVIVLPDHDQAGEKAADALVDELRPLGLKRLRRWRPPEQAPATWDIADPVPDGLDPEALVDAILEAPEVAIPSTGLGEWDAGEVDDEAIPPRGWLLGNVFCRGFVSSLLGDGGVGKTATRYAQLMSLAVGRPLTGEHVFQRCRTLVISLEDDDKELRRRIRAARLHHGVERHELQGWLFVAAPGRGAGKLLTIDKDGRLVTAGLANKIERVIKHRRIDIVSLDPFVKAHAVGENDNNAIDEVVQILTELAGKYHIAVDVPHHISKGQAEPGNANRGRGASAMKDAARLVYTLTPMSPEEGRSFGLDEALRRRLIRMDSGKVNIAPPMAEAKWLRLVGVNLGNATDLYPHGDEVQTVEPWIPPDKWAGLSHHLLNQMLNEIDAGLPDGNRYTAGQNAGARTAWHIIIKHAPDKTEADAKGIIKAWVKSGLLVSYDYENPATRHKVKGLRVENSKRPS